jgi:hypothetical protein
LENLELAYRGKDELSSVTVEIDVMSCGETRRRALKETWDFVMEMPPGDI